MKTKIIIILSLISLSLSAQNFPPPENLLGGINNDSVYLQWSPPDDKSFSHYNIYRRGTESWTSILIGTTTDTTFAALLPPWTYFITYEVSAEYVTPNGESDKVQIHFICPWMMPLPQLIDFEEVGVYKCGLGSYVYSGFTEWELIDTTSFSPTHCAAYVSDTIGEKAMLYTCPIMIDNSLNPTISFNVKIPEINGLSDTLKLYYKSENTWIPIFQPISGKDEWSGEMYSLLELPEGSHFGFEATSGGGGGIFIDEIFFDDAPYGIDFVSDNFDFKIFPNPVQDKLVVKSLEIISSATIIISDIKGSVVFTGNINSAKETIDVSFLKQGIYFVNLISKKYSITKKVIKL